MKLKYIYHYGGLAVLVLMIYCDLNYLYRYLSDPLIGVLYSYSRFLGFVLVPLGLLTGIFLVYLLYTKTDSRMDRAYVLFWVGTAGITTAQYYYFQSESQKLRIIVENLSSFSLYDLKVIGRDMQEFNSDVLKRGDEITFICKCRDATRADSAGVDLSFKFSESKSKRLEIVSFNKPEYRDELQIRVINDTLTVIKGDIKDQWIRLDSRSRGNLYKSKELELLIQKQMNDK